MATKAAPLVVEPGSGNERADIVAGRAWSAFLAENAERFARTLDVPIGKELGCGLFGCVYASTPPWVVKFTRDETEGPVWAYIAELLDDPELQGELDALLRVHDVVRIRPDVLFGGDLMPVYGVVREAALPVLHAPLELTGETLRRLGMTREMLDEADLPVELPSLRDVSDRIRDFPSMQRLRFADLLETFTSLQEYRRAALLFHEWRGRLTTRNYAGHTRTEAEMFADESYQHILHALSLMMGRSYPNIFGVPLATTLRSTLENADLAFRDLHLMNIGWRIFEVIGESTMPPTLVILDPGAMATPYSPGIRETELAANLARYLENARR